MTGAARTPFYGKYRGTVVDNADPSRLGRIRARVPDVFGDHSSGWALPALPYAGKQVGLFLLPPKDALVWIEFEQGDPDYPIWTGCFWADGEVPATQPTADWKVLRTDTVTISVHESGGQSEVKVEVDGGPKVTIGTNGIEIANGQGAKITLQGPKTSLNDDALEVV